MKTRRRFLVGAGTSALATPSAVAAFGRGRPRSARLLSALKFVNDGKLDVAAGSVTQIVGCPFRKGDLAIGDWPQFQLTDGTPVPCTLLSRQATTWSDGSLKFIPAMLQIPVAVAGHKTLSVNVLSGGWLPQPSPRSLSDFTQGISPQVQVDGLDNLSGTWVMELAGGISRETKIVAIRKRRCRCGLARSRQCVSGTQAAQASALRFLHRLARESGRFAQGIAHPRQVEAALLRHRHRR